MYRILEGDIRDQLQNIEPASIQTVITSPPYWGLRDYGVVGQLGLEPTPEEYVVNLVEVFRGVKRVLRDDGTVWLNLGDSYANSAATSGGCSPKSTLGGGGGKYRDGSKNEAMFNNSSLRKIDHGLKPKDLVGIPWLVAFGLRADGWYLRSDIIWHKPNPMPESVTDRPTKSHEYIFLLSKSRKYYYDAEAVREPIKESNKGFISARARTAAGALGGENQHNMERRGYAEIKGANKRSVWTVSTQPYPGAHFATFPPKLIEPCILAGSKQGDTVLDPFAGSGTTLWVAEQNGRDSVGIELNSEYIEIIKQRMDNMQVNLFMQGVQQCATKNYPK